MNWSTINAPVRWEDCTIRVRTSGVPVETGPPLAIAPISGAEDGLSSSLILCVWHDPDSPSTYKRTTVCLTTAHPTELAAVRCAKNANFSSTRTANMHLIIARDERDGIGLDGRIPWWCPDDIDLFRIVTTHTATPDKSNLVIAGHVTRQSMPQQLNGRVLVTQDRDGLYELPDDVTEADIDQKFLVGGKRAIQTYLATNPLPDSLILTRVEGEHDCDISVSDAELHLDKYSVYAEKRMDGATAHVYVHRDRDIRVPSGLDAAGFTAATALH